MCPNPSSMAPRLLTLGAGVVSGLAAALAASSGTGLPSTRAARAKARVRCSTETEHDEDGDHPGVSDDDAAFV